METTDNSVCVDCEVAPEWPEPNPGEMAFLIGSAVAYVAYGGYVVARRHPRWLPIWMTALVTWFTVCKYLICTRCERYGEACDFYYLSTSFHKYAGIRTPLHPHRPRSTPST